MVRIVSLSRLAESVFSPTALVIAEEISFLVCPIGLVETNQNFVGKILKEKRITTTCVVDVVGRSVALFGGMEITLLKAVGFKHGHVLR